MTHFDNDAIVAAFFTCYVPQHFDACGRSLFAGIDHGVADLRWLRDRAELDEQLEAESLFEAAEARRAAEAVEVTNGRFTLTRAAGGLVLVALALALALTHLGG